MVSPILVVGSINYDTICKLDRFPLNHEKVRSITTRDCLGGAGGNTAAWLARLGVTTSLFGVLGSDYPGTSCKRSLTEAGVETSFIFVDEESATGRSVCLSTSQDKRIVTSGGPPLDQVLPFLSNRLSFKPKGVLHVATRETDGLVDVCRYARDEGWILSLELGNREMNRLREIADLAFLNHDELKGSFGLESYALTTKSVEMLLPIMSSKLIVTLGGSGALLLERHRLIRAIAKPVAVMERTGAGDAFDAGFLAAYVHGFDGSECLERGLEVAAKALTYVGGHPE